MDRYGFDGRVAVVTGAGRGIGRAYALLLAERGASVVVNDLGGSMEGAGADAGPASTVATEIVAAGGAAIADTSDVASPDGAQTLVDTAVERFGRVDVAGQQRRHHPVGGPPEVDADNLAQPPRGARRRIVQHHLRRVAAHGRAGLRPDRHDHAPRGCSGSRPTSRTPPPRPGSIGMTSSLADRRCRARHQGQCHRTRRDDPHGGAGCRRLGRRDADGARTSSRRWSRSSRTRTVR